MYNDFRTNNRGSLPPGLSNMSVKTKEMRCWIYTLPFWTRVGILGSLYCVR